MLTNADGWETRWSLRWWTVGRCRLPLTLPEPRGAGAAPAKDAGASGQADPSRLPPTPARNSAPSTVPMPGTLWTISASSCSRNRPSPPSTARSAFSSRTTRRSAPKPSCREAPGELVGLRSARRGGRGGRERRHDHGRQVRGRQSLTRRLRQQELRLPAHRHLERHCGRTRRLRSSDALPGRRLVEVPRQVRPRRPASLLRPARVSRDTRNRDRPLHTDRSTVRCADHDRPCRASRHDFRNPRATAPGLVDDGRSVDPVARPTAGQPCLRCPAH